MKSIKNLNELRIWSNSKDLAIKIYKLVSSFPADEKFGLSSQMQRASVSVMANIAEGFYRETTKELISFLINARGSAGETISHLIISKELNYSSKEKTEELIGEYERLIISINSLLRSLRAKNKK